MRILRGMKGRYRGAVLAMMAVLLICTSLADAFLLTHQRRHLLEDARQQATRELQLMATVARDAILKNDYITVERSFREWGQQHRDVIELVAVARNGFVLAQYRRADPPSTTLTVSQQVHESGSLLMSLRMVKDLSAVEDIVGDLTFHFIWASLLLTLLVGTIAWQVLKHLALRPMEQEVARRRDAEESLQAARDELEQRVRMRTAELQSVNEALRLEVRDRLQAEQETKRLGRQNELLLGSAGEGIVGLDAQCRITFVNPRAARMLGWEPGELIGQSLHGSVHHTKPTGEPYPLQECSMCWPDATADAPRRTQALLWKKDGSSLAVECVATAIREGESTVGVVLTVMDITERQRAERALREQEAKYRLLAEHSTDMISRHSMDGVFTYASPACREVLGYEPEELLGRSAFDLFHPDDTERIRQSHRLLLSDFAVRTVTYRVRRKDGAYVWVETTVKTVPPVPPDEIPELIAVWRDISERKRMEEQLAHDATHDALTGLPNRELFVDRLERALQRARRVQNYRFAVLYLDLDRFKVVNDSLGHLMGDQLLLAIADRLQSELRSMDTVARLGGDEFAILLEEVRDVAEAIKAAERVQSAFARPFQVGGREAFTSASIGVTVGDGSYSDPADLLRDADTAMYRAKEAGKARHAVFDSGMHATAMARLDLETDLRRAAERGELSLAYQPILSLQDGSVAGFEALARWHHPQRGLVLPTDFIPLAEETGLIGPIGAWVLGEACRQAHGWRDLVSGGRPVWVSVNLSGKQVMQPDLARTVEHELRQAGLAHGRLMVEITESVVIEDPEAAVSTLRKLEALGVRLCLDDFGTGYSSLSYLHRFPVEVLKIDRSFVGRMEAEKESEELVRSIIALAKTLGLSVVAEGVETQRQLDALAVLGCDYAQGYLLSPPLEAAAVQTWFARQAEWAGRRPATLR